MMIWYWLVTKGLLTVLGFLGNAEFSPWKGLPEFIELWKGLPEFIELWKS